MTAGFHLSSSSATAAALQICCSFFSHVSLFCRRWLHLRYDATVLGFVYASSCFHFHRFHLSLPRFFTITVCKRYMHWTHATHSSRFVLLVKVTENVTHMWRRRLVGREFKTTVDFYTTSSTCLDPKEFPFGRHQYVYKVRLWNPFLCSWHTLHDYTHA